MKKFLAGLVVGVVLASTGITWASSQVRLLVNGQEINFPESPPSIINNRVMVPARPLAEALGATVTWDNDNRAVVVTSQETADTAQAEPSILAADYEFFRTLGITYKWKVAGPGPRFLLFIENLNGDTLTFPPTSETDITGTTNAGCVVRGKVLEEKVYLHVNDLKACRFIE